MKVLTAAEMRDVDRRTMELGVPGIVLMENAGHRVVEFLEKEFAPLAAQRIVVFCGKGNNGGDGLVIARQLLTRFRPRSLHVLLAAEPAELRGDAAENYRMFLAAGGEVSGEITPPMRVATLALDALLGTGLSGPAAGRLLELIRELNAGFPQAKVVAVDVPSGMASDSALSVGECVRVDATITFTAPKLCHALPPNCDRVGKLVVAPIGSPAHLMEDVSLALTESADFAHLLGPRERAAHKGSYGHALIIAGGRGKTGAAALAGLGALRCGAGLVTVASAASAIGVIASHAAEIMTEPLEETAAGAVSARCLEGSRIDALMAGKTVAALGPGLGTQPETVEFVRKLAESCRLPMVIDADGLNALAGADLRASAALRVLTPHPGEMARLLASSNDAVQADRLAAARECSRRFNSVAVLKGHRTLIAAPDGRVWINPTGSPAMGTGGAGDVLTGMMAGMLAQFPRAPETAIRAAVYLHGLAGELGARELGEQALVAGDLLRFLPEAIRVCHPQ